MICEKRCPVCGKTFYMYPQHAYKIGQRSYCSWKCINEARALKSKKKREYKKVFQFYPDGEKLKTFDSAKEASQFVGCSVDTIRRACIFGRVAKGYLWRYKE